MHNWPYGPPMWGYPPNSQVQFIPVPSNSSPDAVEKAFKLIEKLERKKKEKEGDKKDDKKDKIEGDWIFVQKMKERTFGRAEMMFYIMAAGPFVFFAYAFAMKIAFQFAASLVH